MNKTLILVIVLAALVGVYYLMTSSEPVALPNQPLVNVDSAAVSYMKIATSKDTVELRKEGDGWVVSGAKPYPANQQNIGRAVAKFSQMTRKAQITDKPDRYAEFDLAGENSVAVTFAANGKEQTIYLGKASQSSQTSYARLEGEQAVWEIGGTHASAFKRPPADWRDKTICALPFDSIARVTITYPDLQVVLTKSDSIWNGTQNGAAFSPLKPNVERITRMLSKMNTIEFVDTLADAVFMTPVCTVVGETASGQSVELKFVHRDDKQYFVRKSGAESDFVVYNSTAEVLMKKKDDLIDKGKPAS